MRKLLLLMTLTAAVFAVPALAATKSATLKDDAFSKGKITIKKGDTVKWAWETKHKHTVTDFKGRFGSKGEKRKATFKHKFGKTGKFTVYCLVHPIEMRQKIVVK